MHFIPAHDIVGAPEGPLAFVLHGILGSRRNWMGFVRRLAADAPGWRFALVDLRGHGDSRGATPPHTLEACADDLEALAAQIGAPTAVVGHSFGGKVALAWARRAPADDVWVLDARPGALDGAPAGEVPALIEAAGALAEPFPDRQTVVRWFTERGFARELALWMTTSVRRTSTGLRWGFDLEAIEALLADYWRTDLWAALEDPGRTRMHLVRGGRSARWDAARIARLDAAPGLDHRVLPNAGHWLHVDDPDGLRRLLGETFSAR